MIGLILKDLLFLKNSWKNLLITYICSVILALVLNNYFIALCILPLMLTTSGINAFQTDEFYLAESYALTFPVSRKNMVISRYLFTFLMFIIATFLALITYLFIFLLLKPTSESLNLSMITYLLFLEIISVFINIIFYPIIYKYGCEKSRYVLTSIIMILFCIASLVLNIINLNNIDISKIIYYFQHYGLFILPLILLLMIYLSYKLSVKFFLKNDY